MFALNSCTSGGDPNASANDPSEPTAQLPDESSLVENLALPPPTQVTATATSPTRVDVNWTAVLPLDQIKYYIVDKGPAPGTEVTLTSVAPDKTTWASPNLQPGQQTCWDVRVVNINNEVSARSPESCVTTPLTSQTPVPANLKATPVGADRITLTWSPVTGAIVYHVFEAVGANGTFSQVASTTMTTITIANLLPNTLYQFEVSAVTVGGESPPSPPVSARTFVLGLQGYWKFDETTGTVAHDSSGFARDGALVGATFATTDLPPVNIDNHSTLAVTGDAGSQVTVPGAPQLRFAGGDFSVSAWVKLAGTTATDIIGMRNAGCGTLGWKLGQDPTNGLNVQGPGGTASFGTSLAANTWAEVGFTYAASTKALTMYVNGAQVATTTFTATNPLPTTVPLSIGHVGGCPGGAENIDEVNIFSTVLSADEMAKLGKVPPATTLTVTVNNASTATLTWTPVPGVDLYYVYKGTAPGNEKFFTSVHGTDTTFVGQHLTPNSTNTWFVRTTTGGLPFSTSNEVTSTTPDVLPAPATVTATPVNATRINVAWSAVPGATSYKIFQSKAGAPPTQVGAVLAPQVQLQVANLTTKTTYSYTVLAVDSGGNLGHLSAPVSATTP
ncbi:MAG TPA: fibronectin type III domain-containing protein [Kofleriaceae bacterium]|nr:fibronectin type III domain-containing protein [Kofleriaceae bacterium]